MREFLISLTHAEPARFVFWTLVLAAAAAGAFGFGFRQLRRARLLEDLPTSRIRSAAQGYVEFHGHGRMLPGPEIRAPLSGDRCCWWEYVIEKKQTRQDSSGSRREWITVDRQTSDELFLLDDGSGQCVIDPVGAKVVPTLSRTWRGAQPRPLAYRRDGGWFGLGDYRYTERLVAYGAWLYVLGQFQTQTAFRDDDESRDIAERLAEWKRDQRGLLRRFDANRDGRIDLDEWEVARKAAAEEVRAEHVERSIQPDLHVLSEPKDRRPFILSTRPEAWLTRGMRWTGMAGVGAGIALGAAVAFVLLSRGAGAA